MGTFDPDLSLAGLIRFVDFDLTPSMAGPTPYKKVPRGAEPADIGEVSVKP